MNIECCDYKTGRWEHVDTTWDSNSSGHIIKNLIPGHTYSFRVINSSLPKSSSLPPVPSLSSIPVTIPHETGSWQQDHLIRRYQQLNKILGRGRNSCIEEARDSGTGQKVALKQIERQRQTQCATRNEYLVLLNISHQNIIRSLALFENAPSPGIDTIVLELVHGYDICSFICLNETVDLAILQVLFTQLMNALNFLKENNITHCDIKPENLMVEISENENNPLLKIVDFGSAVCNKDKHCSYSVTIDLEFTAPELLNFPPQVSNAADVWSAGVVLYILLSGVSPFLDESVEETTAHVLNQDFSFPEEYFSHIPESAKELICNILTLDISTRLTPLESLQSSWIKQDMSNVTIQTAILKTFIQRRQRHGLTQHVFLSLNN